MSSADGANLTGMPPYSGRSTLSPSFTATGMRSPAMVRRPGPTAITVPWLTWKQKIGVKMSRASGEYYFNFKNILRNSSSQYRNWCTMQRSTREETVCALPLLTEIKRNQPPPNQRASHHLQKKKKTRFFIEKIDGDHTGHRTFVVADSGNKTPPTDLLGGTSFSTKTRSSSGMSLFADIVWCRTMWCSVWQLKIDECVTQLCVLKGNVAAKIENSMTIKLPSLQQLSVVNKLFAIVWEPIIAPFCYANVTTFSHQTLCSHFYFYFPPLINQQVVSYNRQISAYFNYRSTWEKWREMAPTTRSSVAPRRSKRNSTATGSDAAATTPGVGLYKSTIRNIFYVTFYVW